MGNFILHYGNVVPDNAINLAWIAPPPLSPGDNVAAINVVAKNPANIPTILHEKMDGATVAINGGYLPQTVIAGHMDMLQSPIEVMKPVEDETGAWHLRIRDGVICIATQYEKPATWLSGTTYSYGDRVLHKSASTWKVYTCVTSSKTGTIANSTNSPTGASAATQWKNTSADSGWLDYLAAARGWADGKDIVLVYTIPDTQMEAYLPTSDWGRRGMSVVNDYATFVDEHTVALKNGNIYSISEIKINGVSIHTTGKTALTPSSPNGGEASIQSVDFTNGIIRLTSAINPEDIVQVSYKYSQLDYVYRGYFDPVLGRYCDLDLNPSYGHTYDNGKQTKDLLSSTVYVYLLPAAVYGMDEATKGHLEYYTANMSSAGVSYTMPLLRWESGPAITLPSTGFTDAEATVGITGSAAVPVIARYGEAIYDVSKFTNKLPLDSPQVYTEDGSLGTGLQAGGVGSLKKYPHALVLAKLFVSPNGTIENVKVIDTRTKGGGLPEDLDISVMTGDEIAEMGTYWDIGGWEGDFAMLNGVVVIELPEELLTGADGLKKFTEREIEDIVSKHVAAGVKPIIRYVKKGS